MSLWGATPARRPCRMYESSSLKRAGKRREGKGGWGAESAAKAVKGVQRGGTGLSVSGLTRAHHPWVGWSGVGWWARVPWQQGPPRGAGLQGSPPRIVAASSTTRTQTCAPRSSGACPALQPQHARPKRSPDPCTTAGGRRGDVQGWRGEEGVRSACCPSGP